MSAFWDFSLALYAHPGVSAACIALQDEHGADVDVVLFALWCASRGHRLLAPELEAADAAIAPWREAVVRPARAARRALKPAPPGPFDPAAVQALRKQLLAAELEAERLQQLAMETGAPPPGTDAPGEAASANLRRFAAHAGIPADAPPFAVLLDAVA